MIKKIKNFLGFTTLAIVLVACGSEGIDRNSQTQTANSPSSTADFPGNLGTTGPSRYVALRKLNFEATLPSIISVLFQASNQYGTAIAGLQTSDFQILEDNEPVSESETSMSVVHHEELPFAVKTVFYGRHQQQYTTG